VRSTVGVWAVGIAMVVAARAESAKVLLFLSPFGSGNVCVMNNTLGFNGCSDAATTGKMMQNPLNWMEYDFTSVTNDNLTLSHGTTGNNWAWSSGSFNPYALFQTSDTVWAVTDPYPSSATNVAIKLLGSRPKSKTVMLWNPWETTGKIPWMRVESGAWGKMYTETSLPGWYSSTVLGYNTLTLTFSDSAKTQYLGTRGISDSTRFSVDSIAAVSDTIWVRGAPETGPTSVRASAVQPRAKTLFLFNPWSGKLPVQRPEITIGGAGPFAMHANPDYCGWYTYTYFDRTPSVLFTNERTTATFGKTGIGSTVAFDASFTADSAWISEPAGVPVVSGAPSADRSLCEVSYLAATIRDFASSRPTTDPYYNREFGRGHGCGRDGWGVVRGMTDSILGNDRKPVRSAHDTGANYPNDWTYSFRCTYDTTEPANKAEIGDTGLATNWFRTVPGKNVETCRDIPLALDSTTGNYVYDNPHYFPIDDFSRLSDGTPNPFFEQISGDDGKLHDYGFCLESHGSFEYKKGQIFRFAGDDDVWFFINNRIAVDLGGIHGTAKDSVFLDSIGSYHDPILDSTGKPTYDRSGNQLYAVKWTSARLVENQTYPFDFFFCERDPQGSDMMIQTSMNLRTDSRFQVRDTLRSPGTHTFDTWVSTSQGQGCKAITSLARAAGSVFLWGTSFSRHQLSTGTWYGGIGVDSAKGTVKLDSGSISGLPPGTYTLRIQAVWDSTSHYDYLFTVPFSAGPRFVATPPLSLLPGDVFAVSVASFDKAGLDSASVSFHIHAPIGLALYSDSLRTRLATPADTFQTGTNGNPRRFWAVAVSSGTWALSIGSGSSDTADLWDSISVLSRAIVFLDSTGAVVASPPTLLLDPNESAIVRMAVWAGGGFCTSCSGKIALSPSDPSLILSATTGGPKTDSVVLTGGTASVWVRGTSAPDSGWFKATLGTDPTVQGVRSPIVVHPWRLRFLSGATASDAMDPIDRAVGDSARVQVQVWGRNGPCASCSGYLHLATTQPGIGFENAATGLATDSLAVGAGVATFSVVGRSPVSLDSFLVSYPQATSRWGKPVTFRAAPPDSARMFDRDGDGRADSLVVHLRKPWASGNQLRSSWPDSSSSKSPARVVVLDSITVAAIFDAPFAQDATVSVGAKAWFSWDGAVWSPVPAADGVPPVPVSANISWGDGTTVPDTLRVVLSEAVSAPAGQALVRIGKGAGIPDRADIRVLSIDSKSLVLLWSPASIASCPRPGDSLGLLPAVLDLLGNRPGPDGKKVAIQGSIRPPRLATYVDSDGDGRIDLVRVALVAPQPGPLPTFDISLPGPTGTQTQKNLPAAQAPGDSLAILVPLSSPFPFGWTYVPPGSWVEVSGGTAIATADGAGPAIDTAFVRHTESYDGDDTLLVLPSETLGGFPIVSWLRGLTSAGESNLPDGIVGHLGDTLVVVLPSASADGIRPGDSLRWTDQSRDLSGNPASTRWRPVGGSPRPAYLRITPPTPLFRPDPAVGPISPALEIQVRTGTVWTGSLGTSTAICDTITCSGPSLELNEAMSLRIHVYDLLGVHVASVSALFDPATLPSDRLGRVRVRILWNGRDERGHKVASGIYLMRGILHATGNGGRAKLGNIVWKIGLLPDL
jgi:fibro-slime domain-containing protein